MAAPTTGTGGSGATDAGGAWTYTTGDPNAAGIVVIVQILQDGATTGALSSIVGTNIENLAGTDNEWTAIVTDSPCGSPTAALQHIFIGRTINVDPPTISGANSTSEDLYFIDNTFGNVNTGTTLAAVIENGTAGSTANEAGTGTTVSDAAVQTLGPDRLALAFIGGNDDPASFASQFTGETGGDWGLLNSFGSSTGTDGSVVIQRATMTSAGTINGGTYTVGSSFAWGVVGFALIGTTAGGNTYEKAGFGRESM